MPREPMPSRRASWIHKVRIGGMPFYLTVGEYDDKRPGEIFIDAHKQGTFTRGILDALARMTSLAIQCGAPIEDVVKSLKGLNFPPNGKVTGSVNVEEAASIADWLAQEIEATYLKKEVESITAVSGQLPEKTAGYVSDAWRSGV